MKLRNLIRLNAVVIGIAAALFFTSSVRAQEIENTTWTDTPNTVAFLQAAPQPATQSATQPADTTATDSLAISSSAVVSKPAAAREAAVTQWAAVEIWILCSLLICIAIVALYALIEARRVNREFQARFKAMNPRTTLS